jgi:hypothetical protein
MLDDSVGWKVRLGHGVMATFGTQDIDAVFKEPSCANASSTPDVQQ